MKKNYSLSFSIIFIVIFISIALIYSKKPIVKTSTNESVITDKTIKPNNKEKQIIFWGNIGSQMVKRGVIDKAKFEKLYLNRGGINNSNMELLINDKNNKIEINKNNAGFVLNLFWALGLGNKSPILETGPMSSYGNTNQFASTGGWTISNGNVMDHYNKHKFIRLTSKQWNMVKNVSKNIYRPCCNNATYFPDCNHGMAMLGLLELMASQNANESQMYDMALRANSLWFPGTYFTIQKYLKLNRVSTKEINSRQILSAEYSSASGYNYISRFVPKDRINGVGCGI